MTQKEQNSLDTIIEIILNVHFSKFYFFMWVKRKCDTLSTMDTNSESRLAGKR